MAEQDSSQTVTWMVSTEGVPMSEVELTVPMDSIRKLPVNASYSAKRGQATAKVSRDVSNNIIVYASCDSLERLVAMYQSKVSDYKKSNDLLKHQAEELEQTVSESRSIPLRMLIKAFAAGLLAGIVTTSLIVKMKKTA